MTPPIASRALRHIDAPGSDAAASATPAAAPQSPRRAQPGGHVPGVLALRRAGAAGPRLAISGSATGGPAAAFTTGTPPGLNASSNASLNASINTSINTSINPTEHWRAWATADGSDQAGRIEALRRLEQGNWSGFAGADTKLDLSGLRLASLPPHLPASLTELNLKNNAFSALPTGLPPGLLELDMGGNQLRSLEGNLPGRLQSLNVSNNLLERVPADLPASIKFLGLNQNQLVDLPATLPAALYMLFAEHNQIAQLPNTLPASVSLMKLAGNRLTGLPETLPESLEVADVSNNQIVALPTRWPPALRSLRASGNQLASLPVDLVANLPARTRLELWGNRLPASEQDRIRAALTGAGRPATQIQFAEPVAEPRRGNRRIPVPAGPALPPLRGAVEKWMPPDRTAATAAWETFAAEPHAEQFSQFLNLLRATKNLDTEGFNEGIVELLDALAADPELRTATFMAAHTATESCEDRVSLSLNTMKRVRFNHEVSKGTYDQDLHQLFDLARGHFRLDKLHEVAARHKPDNPLTDPISVVLGLQVKLRAQLDLPIDAKKIGYYALADLKESDLVAAAAHVKEREDQDFPAFLAAWESWHQVIERAEPGATARADDMLHEMVEADFADRVERKVSQLGLVGDGDAERAAGVQVLAEMRQEAWAPEAHKAFGQERMTALLAPRWTSP